MNYYLVGIKGSGMSALALYLNDLGHIVEGCDYETDFFTEEALRERNIPIHGMDEFILDKDFIYVISNAYLANGIYIDLLRHEYIVYKYNQFISTIPLKQIAVSGTHGKTTTTKLVADMLAKDNNVSYIIGDGSGKGHIESNVIIYEACEYKENFLAYYPDYLLINNVELDHTDYYQDLEMYEKAFLKFSKQAKTVVVNGDISFSKKIENKITFGFSKENDFICKVIDSENGVDVLVEHNGLSKTFHLPFFGNHMVYNFMGAYALSYLNGVDGESVQSALNNFVFPKRRMSEYIINDQIIIIDYAHHPTEIKATREAIIDKYGKKEIIAIFEPHTYSRTLDLLSGFVEALKEFDKVFILPIFTSVRETLKPNINFFIKLIPEAEMFDNSYDRLLLFNNSVIVFMGAGSIDKIASRYIEIARR